MESRLDVGRTIYAMAECFKRWGLTPQKPVMKTYERQSVYVMIWLDEEFPHPPLARD